MGMDVARFYIYFKTLRVDKRHGDILFLMAFACGGNL